MKPKKNKKRIDQTTVLVAAVIIFGILIGIVLYTKSNTTSKEVATIQPTARPPRPTRAPTPYITQRPIQPIINGKNYTYGSFSFTYPENWKLNDTANDHPIMQEMRDKNAHSITIERDGYILWIDIAKEHESNLSGEMGIVPDEILENFFKNRDIILIQNESYYVSNNHTPFYDIENFKEGILRIANVIKYPDATDSDRVNPAWSQRVYKELIDRNGNVHSFKIYSRTKGTDNKTPDYIQKDILSILQTIHW
jgi:hypothetical protein